MTGNLPLPSSIGPITISFDSDIYKNKVKNNFDDCYKYIYSSIPSYIVSNEVISSPKILQLPAYGLRHDEIKIKEIDGVLTIKSEPVDKTKYAATINKTYTLKNVIVQNKTLVAGVLNIEFVDSDNVIHHTINKGIDY